MPALRVPDTSRPYPPGALAQYEAVRLFLARAREVTPDCAVTDEATQAVAEICARLDGLPLAIELAAARVRLFPPPALLARLDSRLALLTGGARDLPARQRTLRAMLDWSHGLLSREQQTLFARLAVFVGGGTLDTIEAVCDPDGALDVLDGVESLVEKYLLRWETDVGGEPRFVMLETIHEYALERLATSGEEAAMREAHAAYFLTLAEEAEPELTGPHQAAWFSMLERDHDNLRVALHWAMENRQIATGSRLAKVLVRYWVMRGYVSEGRRWIEALLALNASNAQDVTASIRVALLNGASLFAAQQGDDVRATALADESLVLAQARDDRHGIMQALQNLGYAARLQNDPQRAIVLTEQSLALAQDLGDIWAAAFASNSLAGTAQHQKNFSQTTLLYQEARMQFQEIGDTVGVAHAQFGLGRTALKQGNVEQALARCQESLALARDVGHNVLIAAALRTLALVASAQAKHERAVRLLGAGMALRKALGFASVSGGATEYDHVLDAARLALGASVYETVWVAGQAQSVEQAIAEALEAVP